MLSTLAISGYAILAQEGLSKRPDFVDDAKAGGLLSEAMRWMPDGKRQIVILVVMGLLALLLLLIFLLMQVRYRITEKRLVIAVMGIPVRWVRLDNIKFVSTRRVLLAEQWHNQLFPAPDRVLVIHKQRGILKHLVITPSQRFVFKSELDRAMQQMLMDTGVSARVSSVLDNK